MKGDITLGGSSSRQVQGNAYNATVKVEEMLAAKTPTELFAKMESRSPRQNQDINHLRPENIKVKSRPNEAQEEKVRRPSWSAPLDDECTF